MRKIIVILLLASPGWTENLKIVDFNYKATSLRDPFTNPTAASTRGIYGAQAKTFKQSEIEQQFDPAHLKLKAILSDKKRETAIAVVSKINNPQETYLIEGSKIKHLLSGFTIKNYRAEIKKDQVVLNKISGAAAVILNLELGVTTK